MTQDKYILPDNTTQLASAYKANIDNAFEMHEAGAGSHFQCHENTVPAMTVRVEAGSIYDHTNGTRTAIAAATSSTITAPSIKSRIDLVSVHQTTGAITVTAGVESSTPVAPSLPASNFPVAEIALATTTTAITDELITDARVPFTLAGSAGGINEVSDDDSPTLGGTLSLGGYSFEDSNGNEMIDFVETASAINHIQVTNAATGDAPEVAAVGGESNVDLNLVGKGSGRVVIGNASLKMPNSDGSSGDIMVTDGYGNLSLSTPTVGVVEDASVTFVTGSSPTITSQTNVTSVTRVDDEGDDYYLVTFTSPVASADYRCLVTVGNSSSSTIPTRHRTVGYFDKQTGSVKVWTERAEGGSTDTPGLDIDILIFGA